MPEGGEVIVICGLKQLITRHCEALLDSKSNSIYITLFHWPFTSTGDFNHWPPSAHKKLILPIFLHSHDDVAAEGAFTCHWPQRVTPVDMG